jgi:hypothetical protein
MLIYIGREKRKAISKNIVIRVTKNFEINFNNLIFIATHTFYVLDYLIFQF